MAWLHWPSLIQLAVSFVLLSSAFFEMFDTVIEEIIGMQIEALHGVAFYAAAKLTKEALEFRKRCTEARERIGEVRGEIGKDKAHGHAVRPPKDVPVAEPVSG